MRRCRPEQSVFTAAWNAASSPAECAALMHMTAQAAKVFAWELRKQGHPLKKYIGNNVTAICEACGQEYATYPCQVKAGRKYCSRRCQSSRIGDVIRTHGESHSSLYSSWRGMKSRCANQASPAYQYYGGRGICVCDQWIKSYEAFRDWSLSNGYEPSLEIDRVDTNGNYEPSNCRWATRTQQMRNTRKRVNAKTSKYKGVSWCANAQKWRLQVCGDGNTSHRGLFLTELDAAKAYDRIAREEFGEFAHLNFKEDASS